MAEKDNPADLSREERVFAAEVKNLREEKGWGQEELAERMRQQNLPYVNQTTVSRIENLKRPVRLMEAQVLSRLFRRTITSMTYPNESEMFLHVYARNESEARGAFVKAKNSIRDFAVAQNIVTDELEHLLEMFGHREDLDPEVTDLYELLVENMTQLKRIDILKEAAEIVHRVNNPDRAS